jgi:hypothetical protein
MGDGFEARLWDSAFDFRRAVIPVLANWLPDGYFVGVEDAPDHPAVRVVDKVAGIDGWYVSAGATRLQGIASRVQYGTEPYDSFTIRAKRRSGAPTELEKKLDALQRQDQHFAVPHYTVQAWVERRRTGRALHVLLVRTQDLFEFVVAHPDRVERRRNPADGTEFIVVWADDLRDAGVDVKQGGTTYDVTIRQRGGVTWSPADFVEFEDQDEDEDEEWDEDWDDYCAYCGTGVASSGEVCPACGTFQV